MEHEILFTGIISQYESSRVPSNTPVVYALAEVTHCPDTGTNLAMPTMEARLRHKYTSANCSKDGIKLFIQRARIILSPACLPAMAHRRARASNHLRGDSTVFPGPGCPSCPRHEPRAVVRPPTTCTRAGPAGLGQELLDRGPGDGIRPRAGQAPSFHTRARRWAWTTLLLGFFSSSTPPACLDNCRRRRPTCRRHRWRCCRQQQHH